MKLPRWAIDVVLLALVGLVAFGLLHGRTRQGTSEAPLGRMPEWRLAASDGRALSSEDLEGKVLVLKFWASWCPPCRAEIPGFVQLQEELGGEGLAVVGFSLDETAEDHLRFVRSSGINYPSMLVTGAEGARVVAAFEAAVGKMSGIPTTLVVDRSGAIVYVHTGYVSGGDLEKVVRPLL